MMALARGAGGRSRAPRIAQRIMARINQRRNGGVAKKKRRGGVWHNGVMAKNKYRARAWRGAGATVAQQQQHPEKRDGNGA